MIFDNPQYCMGNRSLWEKFIIAITTFKNPWMLILDKFGFLKNPIYRTKSGQQIYTRPKTTDVNDAVVVLSGREYPPELLGIKNLSNPVVLDAGGHIGSFSLYVKSINPQSQIIVMEPVKENLTMLHKNLSINHLVGITVIDKALYASSGHFYIDLDSKPYDAGQLVTEKPEGSKKYFEIDAITLDEVIARTGVTKIDLMKMDIEGSEYEVFRASLETFRTTVKRVIMEYHIDHHPQGRDEIVSMLCDQKAFSLVYESKNILGFDNNHLT